MAYNLRNVAAGDQERFDVFAAELKRFNLADRSKMDFYRHMAEMVRCCDTGLMAGAASDAPQRAAVHAQVPAHVRGPRASVAGQGETRCGPGGPDAQGRQEGCAFPTGEGHRKEQKHSGRERCGGRGRRWGRAGPGWRGG